MKTVSGKTFIISCIALLSAIFISACGDDNSSSVPDSSLESSSSVEDIERSSDAISSEASTQSSATEPYSSAKGSSSSAVESSSSNESFSSTATPSSPSTESSSSAVASAKDYCSTNFRYKYNHDDANKKFTIFEDHPYDECQHLNGNYTFTHIDEVLQHKRSYFFVGDTLVLIQNNEGDPDTATTVLVGGSANNLLGDWAFTTCDYKAGSISCNNEPKSYTTHYVFEADSQFVYYTLADGSCIPPESLMPSDGTLDKDESYTDTYAMQEIYNSIISIKKGETHNIIIFPFSFFDQLGGGITIPSEVAISSQSKYAVTFTIGGQEFSATLGENTHRIQYYSDAQYEVDLDLASGSKVCHLHYFRDAKLTSETCKAENAPYFELDTHEETGVEYVDSYNVENIDEFKACLITLAQ